MRYSLQLPTDRVESTEEFATADAIGEIAAAIEAAGFDAAYVTEHPFPPDRWLRSGGHHALDPFVALAVAAAATTRLRLHTNILVLGYRNPFLLAKAIASLDVVSGGRLIVGTAAGYLEPEFEALGADFAHRNEVADETLAAMIEAWSGASVTLEGRAFAARGHTARPPPIQRPHPPIWVGGNSVRAMRRAVRFGQCWCPFPQPAAYADRTRTAPLETVDDLAGRIQRLRALESEAGRSTPLDVGFIPFGLRMDEDGPVDGAALRAQAAALGEIGVGWLSLGVRGRTRREARASIDELARVLLD